MNYFAGGNDDQNQDELQRVPEFMRGVAYLDRRQQEILESQLTISSLQRGISNVMFDIAHLLTAQPSAGNQAMLQRSFGELEGLANAVAQSAVSAPSGGDGGASRGADVDLTGIKYAIETHANFSSGETLKDADAKTRKIAATAKELPSLDAAPAAGADQDKRATSGTATPDDIKPAADTPESNLDRVNKLASAESRASDDQAASADSNLPPLPNKRGSRSHVAALKLDHAEAVSKSDAPDRGVAAQSVEPTAQAEPVPSAKLIRAAAVSKLPSPSGC